MIEHTLVLLKPDTIQRSIIGKIITRFEDAGLKIVAMKMLWASQEQVENHYPFDEVWAKQVYEKTKNHRPTWFYPYRTVSCYWSFGGTPCDRFDCYQPSMVRQLEAGLWIS